MLADNQRKTDPEARLFSELKGIALGLARAVDRDRLRLVQGGVSHCWAHPVRQAVIYAGDIAIGYLAEAHPGVLQSLGLNHHTALLELDLDLWRSTTEVPTKYRPLAKFPSVFRDFAVVVDEAVRAGDIQNAIESVSATHIRDVDFQSVFRGGDLPEGKKSMAWSVTIRDDDRTLQEDEIRSLEASIWNALKENVAGEQRG